MKAMILTDLITVKDSLVQCVAIYAVVGLVLACSMKSVVACVACVGTMGAIMSWLMLASYDEANSWQKFRASFPISRKEMMLGRYTSILITALGSVLLALAVGYLAMLLSRVEFLMPLFAVFGEDVVESLGPANNPMGIVFGSGMLGVMVVILGVAFTQPFVAKLGMTKALRFGPVVVVVLLALSVATSDSLLSSLPIASLMASFSDNPDQAFIEVTLVASLVAMAVYVASAFVAAKLYEQREF